MNPSPRPRAIRLWVATGSWVIATTRGSNPAPRSDSAIKPSVDARIQSSSAISDNQLGHTDPAFTLRVYAHSMVGGPDERERLSAIADGYEVVGESTREFERHRVDPFRGAEWVAYQPGPKPTSAKSSAEWGATLRARPPVYTGRQFQEEKGDAKTPKSAQIDRQADVFGLRFDRHGVPVTFRGNYRQNRQKPHICRENRWS